jgi:hypothetical protein
VGVEVFVNWFENGAPAPVPLSAVLATFGVAAGAPEEQGFPVSYGPEDDSFVYAKADDKGELTGLMVERPCADVRLWDSILTLLRLGNGVCFWPGGSCAVGRVDTIRHLPSDMAADLGEPAVAATGAELAHAFEES